MLVLCAKEIIVVMVSKSLRKWGFEENATRLEKKNLHNEERLCRRLATEEKELRMRQTRKKKRRKTVAY